jgi:hypothetical protein
MSAFFMTTTYRAAADAVNGRAHRVRSGARSIERDLR